MENGLLGFLPNVPPVAQAILSLGCVGERSSGKQPVRHQEAQKLLPTRLGCVWRTSDEMIFTFLSFSPNQSRSVLPGWEVPPRAPPLGWQSTVLFQLRISSGSSLEPTFTFLSSLP